MEIQPILSLQKMFHISLLPEAINGIPKGLPFPNIPIGTIFLEYVIFLTRPVWTSKPFGAQRFKGLGLCAAFGRQEGQTDQL
jgi:hypothetical protein